MESKGIEIKYPFVSTFGAQKLRFATQKLRFAKTWPKNCVWLVQNTTSGQKLHFIIVLWMRIPNMDLFRSIFQKSLGVLG